jgi:Mitochondrial biogenesis AIM24
VNAKGTVMHAEVKGTTIPILEVSLDRGEQVISAHGEMAWMTQTIQMSQTTSTGGQGGLMQGLKRVMSGGLFLTRYEGPGAITFAAKIPVTSCRWPSAPARRRCHPPARRRPSARPGTGHQPGPAPVPPRWPLSSLIVETSRCRSTPNPPRSRLGRASAVGRVSALGQAAVRSCAAAWAMADSLPKAASRGRYFIPQSGASTSRSAGT